MKIYWDGGPHIETKRWYFHLMSFGRYAAHVGAVSQLRIYDKKNDRVFYQHTVKYQPGMI